MNEYIDYVKCGYILLAPSASYKDQYVLKCSECDEFYSVLETFLSHCVGHEKYSSPSSTTRNRMNSYIDGSQGVNDGAGSKSFICEEITGDDEEDPLEQPVLNEQDDLFADYTDMDDDECSESDDEFMESEDSKTQIFVRNFVKSEENLITLIAAYKNQPHLWNTKLFAAKIKMKKEREICFKQIAVEVKNHLNIDMTNNTVAAVISRLRQDYREKLKRLKSNEQRGEQMKKSTTPIWFFEKLQFLEPFLDYYSIVKLDYHQPHLEPEQIIKILDIYKGFPHLWDTNLIENVCTNKRMEALGQMTKVVDSEMGLKVNENALKKYLYCIHGHFCREKGYNKLQNNSPKDISIYYEHMMFLYEHVGPFNCSECGRTYKSPLHLKAHKSQCNGSARLKCSLCSKEYEQVEPYIYHARRHMSDMNIECKECRKTFLRPADLKIHMRSHTGSKPYFCETCGASFTQRTSLAAHRKRHGKQYKMHCPICSKGFYENHKMNIHIRTHSNVRDYACTVCGKSFKTKKTMQSHEFIHEKGRNHRCTLCGKMFKNKIGLAQHMRTHRSNVEIKLKPFLNT